MCRVLFDFGSSVVVMGDILGVICIDARSASVFFCAVHWVMSGAMDQSTVWTF